MNIHEISFNWVFIRVESSYIRNSLDAILEFFIKLHTLLDWNNDIGTLPQFHVVVYNIIHIAGVCENQLIF